MKNLNAYDSIENKTNDILELAESQNEKDLYLKALLIASIIDLRNVVLKMPR